MDQSGSADPRAARPRRFFPARFGVDEDELELQDVGRPAACRQPTPTRFLVKPRAPAQGEVGAARQLLLSGVAPPVIAPWTSLPSAVDQSTRGDPGLLPPSASPGPLIPLSSPPPSTNHRSKAEQRRDSCLPWPPARIGVGGGIRGSAGDMFLQNISEEEAAAAASGFEEKRTGGNWGGRMADAMMTPEAERALRICGEMPLEALRCQGSQPVLAATSAQGPHAPGNFFQPSSRGATGHNGTLLTQGHLLLDAFDQFLIQNASASAAAGLGPGSGWVQGAPSAAATAAAPPDPAGPWAECLPSERAGATLPQDWCSQQQQQGNDRGAARAGPVERGAPALAHAVPLPMQAAARGSLKEGHACAAETRVSMEEGRGSMEETQCLRGIGGAAHLNPGSFQDTLVGSSESPAGGAQKGGMTPSDRQESVGSRGGAAGSPVTLSADFLPQESGPHRTRPQRETHPSAWGQESEPELHSMKSGGLPSASASVSASASATGREPGKAGSRPGGQRLPLQVTRVKPSKGIPCATRAAPGASAPASASASVSASGEGVQSEGIPSGADLAAILRRGLSDSDSDSGARALASAAACQGERPALDTRGTPEVPQIQALEVEDGKLSPWSKGGIESPSHTVAEREGQRGPEEASEGALVPQGRTRWLSPMAPEAQPLDLANPLPWLLASRERRHRGIPAGAKGLMGSSFITLSDELWKKGVTLGLERFVLPDDLSWSLPALRHLALPSPPGSPLDSSSDLEGSLSLDLEASPGLEASSSKPKAQTHFADATAACGRSVSPPPGSKGPPVQASRKLHARGQGRVPEPRETNGALIGCPSTESPAGPLRAPPAQAQEPQLEHGLVSKPGSRLELTKDPSPGRPSGGPSSDGSCPCADLASALRARALASGQAKLRSSPFLPGEGGRGPRPDSCAPPPPPPPPRGGGVERQGSGPMRGAPGAAGPGPGGEGLFVSLSERLLSTINSLQASHALRGGARGTPQAGGSAAARRADEGCIKVSTRRGTEGAGADLGGRSIAEAAHRTGSQRDQDPDFKSWPAQLRQVRGVGTAVPMEIGPPPSDRECAPVDAGSGAWAGPGSGEADTGLRLAVLRKRLLRLAEVLQSGKTAPFVDLYKQLKSSAKAKGKAPERALHYCLKALMLRFTGGGYASFREPLRTNFAELRDARIWYYTAYPTCPFVGITIAGAVIPHLIGRQSVHVIDLGQTMIPQWPAVIRLLACQPRCRAGAALRFRFTYVDTTYLVAPGRNELKAVRAGPDVGRMLQRVAEAAGVSFSFELVDLEEDTWHLLYRVQRDPDAALVVCAPLEMMFYFSDPGDKHPRFQLFQWIKSLRPVVVPVVEIELQANAEALAERVRCCFDFHTALFGAHDATFREQDRKRMLVFEECWHGRTICSMLACEGLQRIVRPVSMRQLSLHFTSLGFRTERISRKVVDSCQEMLESYPPQFSLVFDSSGSLQLCWKGVPTLYACAWVLPGQED